MSDRTSRFERLERPRPQGPDGDGPLPAEGRFEAVEAGGPAAAGRIPSAAGDRFREPAPRPPDLAEASPEEQPFLRCRRCETDNSRYGRACTTCGEELHGPEQRAFNERLWAERRRQRQEEELAAAERQAARARAEEEARAAQRAAAEAMAREVGRRERSRLEAEEGGGGRWGDPWGGGGGWGGDRTPPAIRLLRRIRDPRWRIAAIAGFVGLIVLFVALARAHRLFLAGAFVLVALLLPPSRGAWRRRRWW